jgi:ferric-dicitrate binding protein FerR (iron transport regulator)
MIDNVENRANEIGSYLSGNCSDAEVDALMRWKDENGENLAFFEEMESVWQITQPSDQLVDVDLHTEWDNITEAIYPTHKRVAMRRRMYRAVGAIAAIALLGMMIFSQNEGDVDNIYQPLIVSAVQPDANELVILPDGSRVWLRSGSEISYDEEFSPRNVTLKGEGFFEVTSDPEHPFTVKTENAFVRVLGTKFNLRETDDGDVELYVEEGRVAFGEEEKMDAQLIVTRDQVAVFRVNTLEVEAIDTGGINRMSWKTGNLSFDDASLTDVLTDLERHYHIKFEVADENMLDCELKADFDNTTVEEVIETIEFMMSWEITLDSDVYVITGNPCKNQEK